MISSCGGGSGGGKLKKNDYLGNIPALYAEFNAQKEAAEKKLEEQSNKLMAGGEKNYDRVQKMFDEAGAAEKALKEKLNADVAAELAKVVGKEVPVTYSAALSPYYVATVKMAEYRGEPRLAITLTAIEDFTVPSMKAYDYMVYYRLVGKDGAELTKPASTIIAIPLAREEKSFKAGDVLTDAYTAFVGTTPDRAEFAGVEFITNEEYNNLNK
jgi:hypothetical protein